MEPRVRQEVYDVYWYFAAERQAIFKRRAEGEGEPWTGDPILREFKFCNSYRASDRVSQYLMRDVIYDGDEGARVPEDTFLRIVLFRLFSKERTWEALEWATGGVSRATFDCDRLGSVLDDLRTRQSIYTAAFILCAFDAFGHPAKHRNHLALVEHMFGQARLGRSLARALTLGDVYELLLGFPMIGPFMAYQIAIDLNYSHHLAFSENDFTMPGPGAIRGLRKVFEDFGDHTPSQLIHRMVDRQEEEFARLDLAFDGLYGRPLHAIDCQGLFCETDKYARRKFPELKSNRMRIKQAFKKTPEPLTPFYPPKWGINERIHERVARISRSEPGLRVVAAAGGGDAQRETAVA